MGFGRIEERRMIMDYKKKYKEALERARTIVENQNASSVWKDWLCNTFPELKESEDERIRKELLDYCKTKAEKYPNDPKYKNIGAWIAWLEKQGKLVKINPTEFDTRLQALIGKFDSLPKEELIGSLSFWLNVVQNDETYKPAEKQGEQKPIDMSIKEKAHQIAWETSKHYDPLLSKESWCEMAALDMASWIEKQGNQTILDYIQKHWSESEHYLREKRKHEPASNEQQGKSALEAIHEQNPDNANKVERKFKVGDYIANDYCKGKVIELTTDAYLLDTEQGIPFSYEHNAHIWTLADAREGDVLFSPNHNLLWIYMDKEQYHAAINLNYANFVSFGADIVIPSDVQPATKEQRDTLFARMKEEGYEWDAEKKELKKVETIDTYCKENCKGYQETGKCYADGSCEAKIKAEQNSSWTEEDERNLQNIDSVLFREISLSEDECMRLRDWLQSIKERAVWKPSEEQIEALESAMENCAYSEYQDCLKELIVQLKKL